MYIFSPKTQFNYSQRELDSLGKYPTGFDEISPNLKFILSANAYAVPAVSHPEFTKTVATYVSLAPGGYVVSG